MILGEQGTEQFTVTTRVDGKTIKLQAIHDPFISNTTMVGISRWGHFLAIFRPTHTRIEVIVSGSFGAQRAIMMLDPKQLKLDSEEILDQRRVSREESACSGNTIGFHERTA